jgi:hypothetical protein
MTMKPGSAPPAATKAPRNQVIVILDLVAAIALTFVGGSFMFFLIAQGTVFLQPFGVILMILSVASWFGGTAMFILFAVRRRVSFYWPVVGIAMMFAFFYLLVFIATRVVR